MGNPKITDISWYDFGVDLITAQDLDPIYTILVAADLPDDLLKRVLLAYWCFYHIGVASYVAEAGSDRFYAVMAEGLEGTKWPRGFERRHWRKTAARNSLQSLKDFGSPEAVVDYMTQPLTFPELSKRVQRFYAFGQWIAWKIGDMTERVIGYDLDFSGTSLMMWKDPVMAAAMIKFGDKRHPITEGELNEVCADFLDAFRHYNAPPWFDRRVNIQEVETILCKYKAHKYGFYPMGNDTKHLAHAGLDKWGDLSTELLGYLIQYCSYAKEEAHNE
jgi:hypothetical protein